VTDNSFKPAKYYTSSARDDNLLANVALLYYQEGLNQSDIAKRMGLSRATIINYLRESRERGIVDIRVNGEALKSARDSKNLSEKYDLKDVYIAHVGDIGDAHLALRQTARVASIAFHNIIEPGDIIGVAWGETIKMVGEELPNSIIEGTQVCQVVGAMESDRLLTAETCAIQIANRIGAQCHTLHAPAVLSSASLARELRLEPSIHKQLNRFKNLNAILTSVGDVSGTPHVLSSGIIGLGDLHDITKLGGAGFICSRFINSSGRSLSFALEDRMIAIDIDEIKKTPKRILVASGLKKLDAVRAVFAGHYVTHAILDSALAEALLKFK